jgi:ATP-binding cassette subfamily B protein
LYVRTHPHAAQRRIVFITTAIRAFQRPLLFWALAAVINGPIAAGKYRATLIWSLGFLLLAVSTAIVLHFRSRAQNEFGEFLVHDLRNDLFANLQRQPASYYHKTKLGRILSRVVSDLEATRRGVQLVVFIAQEFLQLAICSALMLYSNWSLFLIILGFAPLLLWCNRRLLPSLHDFSRVAAESSSRLTGVLAESVRGIRVIQGFTRQTRGQESFNVHADRLAEDNVRLASTSALYAPLLGLTGQIFIAAMLIVGGYGALHGFAGLKIESLVSFFFLPTSFFLSVQAAASYYPQILAAQVGTERVFQLIDLQPEWEDAPGARDLPDLRDTANRSLPSLGARVEFHNVSFGYNPERLVLHNINFIAEPGQTLALVGHTGSGKSTIANLTAKLYLPTHGAVLIDGHEIRTLRSEGLHRQMGIVHQTNFLFTGTIKENIRFGRPETTDTEVAEAARQLDCLDLFERLPRGLETQVGEGGASLSLGQRQLVCFARALLADPRILILDEATSSVDPVTEQRLQRALAKLLTGRTSFVVAHRLSTIVRADQILVLDEGRIVERGRHRDLLVAGGKYRALYRQFVFAGLAAKERTTALAQSEIFSVGQLQPAI